MSKALEGEDVLEVREMNSNDYFQTRFTYREERKKFWAILTKYLEHLFIHPNSVVLDMGAGYCDFINQLKAREKHALDISLIVKKYAAADVLTHVGSCVEMPDLADGYFDIVFSSNLLEHLSRMESIETLQEIHRILKDRGRIILIQPNFRICYKIYFDDYTHCQIFTDRSLSDFIKSMGFHVIYCAPKFLPFSLDSIFPKSAWLLKPYLYLPFKPFAGQMLLVAEKE